MSITRRTCAAAAAGVLTIALAGCGGDDGDSGEDFADLPIAEIRDAVFEDMRDAKSLTISGTVPSDDGGEVTLDVSMNSDGHCVGEFGSGDVSAEILRTDDGTFMRADQQFWEASTGDPAAAAAITDALDGRWAKFPETDAADFDDFCDLDSFIGELDEDEDEDTKDATKGEVEDVDGEQALEIIDEDDDGTTTHVWVATEGDHYILKFEGDESQTMTITDYNEPVDAETPADDDWVDLAEL